MPGARSSNRRRGRCCGSPARRRRRRATRPAAISTAAAAAAAVAAVALGGCGGGGEKAPAPKPRPDLAPHTATTRAVGRAEILAAVRRAITADARARVRRGEFRGPVRRTDCDQRPGPAEGHEDVVVYSCIAVTFVGPRTSTAPPLRSGQLFQVRVNYPQRSFTWCKVEPPGGEGAGRPGRENAPDDSCGGIG